MKDISELFVGTVLSSVLDYMQVDSEEAVSKKRNQELVIARMLMAYGLLYRGFSSPLTGKLINRDHTTVIYYKKLFSQDKLIKDHIYKYSVFMADKGIFVPGYVKWLEALNERSQNRPRRAFIYNK